VLTFVIGALVFGAFAPRKTGGFAVPGLRRPLAAMRAGARAAGRALVPPLSTKAQ